MAFMERCHARYGDIFTLKIANEGTWVLLAHPDMVKQVFTGDPAVFHAGEGNVILRPLVGSNSVLTLDDGAHMVQRKLLLPPFHGERMQSYGDLLTEIADREIDSWPWRTALPPLAADAGDHPRGDPARGLRPGRRRAPGCAAHPPP